MLQVANATAAAVIPVLPVPSSLAAWDCRLTIKKNKNVQGYDVNILNVPKLTLIRAPASQQELEARCEYGQGKLLFNGVDYGLGETRDGKVKGRLHIKADKQGDMYEHAIVYENYIKTRVAEQLFKHSHEIRELQELSLTVAEIEAGITFLVKHDHDEKYDPYINITVKSSFRNGRILKRITDCDATGYGRMVLTNTEAVWGWNNIDVHMKRDTIIAHLTGVVNYAFLKINKATRSVTVNIWFEATEIKCHHPVDECEVLPIDCVVEDDNGAIIAASAAPMRKQLLPICDLAAEIPDEDVRRVAKRMRTEDATAHKQPLQEATDIKPEPKEQYDIKPEPKEQYEEVATE